MQLLCGLMLTAALAGGSSATPQQPASTGREVCSSCHEAVGKQFDQSVHGQLAAHELQGKLGGCESCHGPGAAHAEGGDVTKIKAFSQMTARQKAEACLSCHRHDETMHWAGSVHASADVVCTDCHKIHQSRKAVAGPMASEGAGARQAATAPAPKGSLAKPETELCLGCHREQKAKTMAASHHPVREGRMSCSSCHQPHGSSTGSLRTGERPNDLCLKCHAKHQGPFVFEHAPVSENCLTCHDPHGAVSRSLLRQNEPFLCLQCHEMHFHSARVSQTTPLTLPTGGSTNRNGVTGFMSAFNTRCTSCHVRIHGSDLPSQGVSGRGKALTR
jgi:predicted CXXCH cytochrome family protein